MVAWRRLLLLSALALGACVVWRIASPDRDSFPDPSALQSGDIVFIRGISFRSGVVRLLEGAGSDYSHVGLVVIESGRPSVIHADPSSNPANDRVVTESWFALIAPTRIRGATVFRLADRYTRAAPATAARVALGFAREALPFDHDFDLHTSQKLYCTELVWRAYVAAGIDLMGSSFGADRKYLLPSDLIASGFLRDIDDLPNLSARFDRVLPRRSLSPIATCRLTPIRPPSVKTRSFAVTSVATRRARSSGLAVHRR